MSSSSSSRKTEAIEKDSKEMKEIDPETEVLRERIRSRLSDIKEGRDIHPKKHERKLEPKSLPPDLTYLSYEYQVNGVERMFETFRAWLDYFLQQNKSISPGLGDLVKTLLQDITLLTLQFERSLEKDKTKPEHLRLGENPILLNTYLKALDGRLQQALSDAENFPHSVKLKNLLTSFRNFVGEQTKGIKQAIDPQVYQVQMPRSVYEKLRDKKTFHYEGTGKAVAKGVLGTLGGLASGSLLVLEFVFFPIAIADVARMGGEGMRALAKGAIAGAECAHEGITRYGRHCKEDIPAEFFVAQVKFDENGKPVPLKANPSYNKEKYGDEEMVTFYVIDGRGPDEIFAKGTNYHLGQEGVENPHGHVVFFETPADAIRFVSQNTDDRHYDPKAGWRLQRDWTPEQKKSVSDSIQAREKLLSGTHTSFATSSSTSASTSGASSSSSSSHSPPTPSKKR